MRWGRGESIGRVHSNFASLRRRPNNVINPAERRFGLVCG